MGTILSVLGSVIVKILLFLLFLFLFCACVSRLYPVGSGTLLFLWKLWRRKGFTGKSKLAVTFGACTDTI